MTETDGPDRATTDDSGGLTGSAGPTGSAGSSGSAGSAEELERAERTVMTELDPGARAMVVAGLVLVLLVTFALPHAGSASVFDVRSGIDSAVAESIDQYFEQAPPQRHASSPSGAGR